MTPTPTLTGTRVTKTEEELAAGEQGVAAPRVDSPPLAPPKPGMTFETGTDGRTCSWPIGDPGEPDFRFCGAPAAIGRPYCANHCGIAYIRKDRAPEPVRRQHAALRLRRRGQHAITPAELPTPVR